MVAVCRGTRREIERKHLIESTRATLLRTKHFHDKAMTYTHTHEAVSMLHRKNEAKPKLKLKKARERELCACVCTLHHNNLAVCVCADKSRHIMLTTKRNKHNNMVVLTDIIIVAGKVSIGLHRRWWGSILRGGIRWKTQRFDETISICHLKQQQHG